MPHDVSLVLAGHEHRNWTSIEIDSDLLTPADSWRLTLGLPEVLPDYLQPWARVRVAIDGSTVLTGRIDQLSTVVHGQDHALAISGRDDAAVLVDCSAPVFGVRQMGLDEVVATIVRPLGITAIRVQAGGAAEKEGVEPGMTAWEALDRVAGRNGMQAWFDPDGTLVVGGPDYSAAPVGDLVMRRDGKGNNLLGLELRLGIQGRYSQVTVLGQTSGLETSEGQGDLKAVARDSSVTWSRPFIQVDPHCETTAVAQARGRKLLADGKLQGFELLALVRGYAAPNGSLWQPGQMVRVRSEPHGVDGTYFLMRRTFLGGLSTGQRTELSLREAGVWLPDVAKTRKRKGGAQALEVVG